MATTIKFVIKKDGTTNLEVDGVVGQSCAQVTKPFEEALGVKVDVQTKPEFDVVLDDLQNHAFHG